MPKSHGERRKTRYKLKKSIKDKGLSPVSRAIRNFEQGQMVHVDVNPSVHKGMPNPKFHGRTGKILGQRGNAYIVEVSDGNSIKMIIANPQHLKPQK